MMKQFIVFDGASETRTEICRITGKNAKDAIRRAYPDSQPELRYWLNCDYSSGRKGLAYYCLYHSNQLPEGAQFPCVQVKPAE